MVQQGMSANLTKVVGAIAGDLESPRIIDDIDRVIIHLLGLREIAADLHGDTRPAPVVPLASLAAHAAPSASEPAPRVKNSRGYDGSIRSLIACYQNDPNSQIHKLRFKTRENYTHLCNRIERSCGDAEIKNFAPRDVLHWYGVWSGSGVPMAHALVRMLRSLLVFGSTILEDEHCTRLSHLLSQMRFEMGGTDRNKQMTADHAQLIRAQAHLSGYPSMALAQAIQFDCRLRQKDVVGEWVPEHELGEAKFRADGKKWLRGLSWSDIDENFILRHVTSKRGKLVEVNLRTAPMVVEELKKIYSADISKGAERWKLPSTGPVIVFEPTKRPYSTVHFRELWRKVARAAGVPDSVRNADSRVGKSGKAADVGDDDLDEEVDISLELGAQGLPH